MTHDWQTQDLECQRRFSRNLRAARERARLTQADVAEAMEMTVTVYARYERGKIWPSIGSLRRLCDVLGCSADSLLGLPEGEGEPSPESSGEPPEPSPEPSPESSGEPLSRPPAEPLPVRRLRRQLRQADAETLRLVEQMLDKLQESGVLPEPEEDAADRDLLDQPPAGDSPVPDSDVPGDR